MFLVWFGLWNFSAEVVHGPLFRDITPSGYERLDTSFNVISIKVAESDVRYPIHIYGTVLARDKNDYRCVYLFKRGRDEPQVITRKVCIHLISSLLAIARLLLSRLSVSRSLLIQTFWSLLLRSLSGIYLFLKCDCLRSEIQTFPFEHRSYACLFLASHRMFT